MGLSPVLSAVIRGPLSGTFFEGASAEPTAHPSGHFDLMSDPGAHPERDIDLGEAMCLLRGLSLRSHQEHAHQIFPEGAPASTIGAFAREFWTATSPFIVGTPLLIAGADFAPSSSTYPANVTATTSATLEVRREFLKSRFSEVLADAKMEEFEFGADSNFSRRIARLVLQYGGEGLATLEATIIESRAPVNVLGELLRTIGRIRSATTHEDQRAFLLRFLSARDIRVRHVAATGLAEMDDPATIPALQTALGAEPSERLRLHLRLVLDQLQATSVALRRRQPEI